jgi:hypothetical protein
LRRSNALVKTLNTADSSVRTDNSNKEIATHAEYSPRAHLQLARYAASEVQVERLAAQRVDLKNRVDVGYRNNVEGRVEFPDNAAFGVFLLREIGKDLPIGVEDEDVARARCMLQLPA